MNSSRLSFKSRILIAASGLALAIAGSVWITQRSSEAGAPASQTSVTDASRRPAGLSYERTPEELRQTLAAIPCDRTVLTKLDLSRPPSEAELIAAGNLGEPLTPTSPADPAKITNPSAARRQEQDNLEFGTAIQAWNEHRYQDARALFEKHASGNASSPWAAESKLHLGCYDQYNGQLSTSAEQFDEILATVPAGTEMHHKATLRRSILHLDQGNLEASEKGFASMIRNDPDPRHQTYASYWLREISLLKKHETSLRDCGQRSLAYAARRMGNEAAAQNLDATTAAGPHGFNAEELFRTALINGLDPKPVQAVMALDQLPLPFVAHYKDRHYVTVDRVTAETVTVFDTRAGTIDLPRKAFEYQWSGFAMLFREAPAIASIQPASDLGGVVGGCCGLPRQPADLGDDDCDKNCGLPGWSVNMINLNFRVKDTPMWWDAPAGPSVYMTLLFNSQDSLNSYIPFGEKWSFEYASFLLITPGSQVQVKDGDGRMETFGPPSPAPIGYPRTFTSPPGDFRVLVETADHVFTLTSEDGTIHHYSIPAGMSASVPLLTAIEDRHGNTLSIEHNTEGAITALSHSMLPPVGSVPRKWVLTYGTVSGHSRVTRMDDPFGRYTTFSYDSAGNLNGQRDMGGITYGYTYATKLSLPISGPAAPQLFITSITTPRGTTQVSTEPSDGIPYSTMVFTPAEVSAGYWSGYPPIGAPIMDTNYRIRITDPAGKLQEYNFDGFHQVGYHRDPAQMPVAGQSVDPEITSHTKYVYGSAGGKGVIGGTSWRSAQPGQSVAGGPVSSASGHSAQTRLPSTTVDDRGNTTTYTYNLKGKPLTATVPDAEPTTPSTDNDHLYTYTYATNGIDLTKVTRNLNSIPQTLFEGTYYPNRDPKTVTDGVGRVSTLVWNTNGLISSVTDMSSSDVTTYHYDSNWRPYQIKVNGVVVSTTGYDEKGRLLSTLDADGYLRTFTYDHLNRLTREDEADTSFTVYQWACCFIEEIRSGKVVSGTDRVLDRTRTLHDARALPISSIDTAGKTTSYAYDAAGRLITLTDPKGQVTNWTYDGVGRIRTKQYPGLSTEVYVWGIPGSPSAPAPIGQLATYRNRRNQAINFTYTPTGLLKRAEGPGVDQRYNYDTWERILTTETPLALGTAATPYIVGLVHDNVGRVIRKTHIPTGSVLRWVYDDTNRSVTLTNYEGPILGDVERGKTTFDSLGRVATSKNPLGLFTYGYSGASSRVSSVTHTGGLSSGAVGGTAYAGFDSTYTYHGDTLRQALETITQSRPGGNVIGKHTYGYDSLGRISSWKREAPLANPTGVTRSFQWTSSYDVTSQLTGVMERSLVGVFQNAWNYAYDTAGNIASTQSQAAPATGPTMFLRHHNSQNQLTSIGGGGDALVRGTVSEPSTVKLKSTVEGWPAAKPARMVEGNQFEADLALGVGTNLFDLQATDGSGNASTYRYQVTVPNPATRTFTYDTDGNLTADGVRTYTWDSLSRLTKINWNAGGSVEFFYNGFGERTIRVINGSYATRQNFVYDGTQLFSRSIHTSTTPTLDRFYHSQGEQRKLGTAWLNYHYTKDHLGSVREVVRWDGVLMARYDYDPYGKRINQYQAATTVYADPCDIGYTGHPTVGNGSATPSELVLAHFRAYDPEQGRWLSADPIGEIGGMNLYAYVGGNPINEWDPTGLASWSDHWEALGSWTGDELGESLGLGAMATADGFIPFSDPFQDSGSYDPCADGVGFSKAAGALARDAAMMAGGLPLAGSKRFVALGSSKGTNAAGKVFRSTGLGKIKLPFRVHLPVGGSGTGTPLRWPGTRNLATALGRSWPWTAYGTTATDAANGAAGLVGGGDGECK